MSANTSTDTLSYARSALFSDYCRAGLGLLACGLPVLLAEPMPWLFWLLLVITAFFAAFGLRTVFRSLSRYRLDGQGLSQTAPIRRQIPWSTLISMKLRYYTTRRNREQSRDAGWFQLHLHGNGGKITIDSNLNGFDEILKASARAAGEQGLALDQATRDNLAAVGVATAPPVGTPVGENGEQHGQERPS